MINYNYDFKHGNKELWIYDLKDYGLKPSQAKLLGR
jgi:hypothetical protein